MRWVGVRETATSLARENVNKSSGFHLNQLISGLCWAKLGRGGEPGGLGEKNQGGGPAWRPLAPKAALAVVLSSAEAWPKAQACTGRDSSDFLFIFFSDTVGTWSFNGVVVSKLIKCPPPLPSLPLSPSPFPFASFLFLPPPLVSSYSSK